LPPGDVDCIDPERALRVLADFSLLMQRRVLQEPRRWLRKPGKSTLASALLRIVGPDAQLP